MKRLIALSIFCTLLLSPISSDAYTKRKKPTKRKPPVPCVKLLSKCPEEGCGGDPGLNIQKNREDIPRSSEVKNMTIARIIDLNVKSPKSWKRNKDRTELQELGEGTVVAVKGYLINAHDSGQEATNCFMKDKENNDFHLNIVTAKNESTAKKILMKQSLVIEMSPRKRDARWKLTTLQALADQRTYVRVTGWLMYDTAHTSFKHMPRATAWEVHPITKFEVCQGTRTECDRGDRWVALEVL